MRKLITIAFAVCLSAPVLALSPYTAIYEGKVSGFRADTHTSLSADDSGRMEFRSVAKARGMARMLKHDPIVESSQFVEIDGRYRAIEYNYLFNQSGSKRNAWIKFDRDKLIAKSLYKKAIVELDINSDHVDRVLETLVFRTDLMAGEVAEKYPYIDRNTLREAVYELLGTETVKTVAGEFDAIKYRRQRVGSSRSAIIWFAPELEFLPIQMQHFNGEKLTGTAILKYYALGNVTPR